MQRWRLFLPTTAVVLTLALPTAAQPPLPLSPETRGYVERRLDAAEREEKALTRRVASARKRAVWSDVVRMMRVEDEVVVLSWALGQVQDELRELRLLDLRRRGKPIGGDPRANLRHYSEQAVGLIASRDYYLKKRDETEAAMRALAASPRRRPGDVEMIQWAVEAYPALMAAIANRQVTDDHLLAALGAPGAATLDAAQRRAEAEREEAMRLRAAREAYEGQQAVEQLLGAAASFVGVFLEAVTEMSNHDLKDLGDGGAQARASRAFSPVGLHHGEMLGRILMGESVPRDMRVRLAFDAYVVKFSGMCEKFLPADQVQIDENPRPYGHHHEPQLLGHHGVDGDHPRGGQPHRRLRRAGVRAGSRPGHWYRHAERPGLAGQRPVGRLPHLDRDSRRYPPRDCPSRLRRAGGPAVIAQPAPPGAVTCRARRPCAL